MKQIAFGWRPEVKPPQRIFSRKLSATPLPRNFYLNEYIPSLVYQGPTPTCVSNAFAQGLRMKLLAEGYADAPLASRHFLHRLSRETHGEGGTVGGTYVSAPFQVVRELGWPIEQHLPWIPTNDRIIMPIPDSVRYYAADQRHSVEDHAIVTMEDELIQDLKVSIFNKSPVQYGVMVDTGWMDYDSWKPWDFDGHEEGGHSMLLVGWEEDDFVTVNSWPDWGVGGFGLVSRAAVLRKLSDYRSFDYARRDVR